MEINFSEKASVIQSIKMTPTLKNRLRKQAQLNKCTMSKFVKLVLVHYLDMLEKEQAEFNQNISETKTNNKNEK